MLTETKFIHFNHNEVVGHWHNDMPGLIMTSKVIAKSKRCPRQIVEYSNLVYGFQCHLEFTAESITELIENSHCEFDDIDSHHYFHKPQDIIANSNVQMNSLLMGFMDKLVAAYQRVMVSL